VQTFYELTFDDDKAPTLSLSEGTHDTSDKDLNESMQKVDISPNDTDDVGDTNDVGDKEDADDTEDGGDDVLATKEPLPPSPPHRNSSNSDNSSLSLNERGREDGGARRKYLKELLISHSLWLDGRFWEQALWQCVLDQLVMIQLEERWHDMEPEARLEAVRRVHDVIFSQVMAIAHSMSELGCSKASAREFVYRMCVVHQLSERQQHDLLEHLNVHGNNE
jgi:hypothetical protein